MPKGRVEPREVTCRGCGHAFTSDRPGKAAWYCGDCRDSPRKREPYVPVAQRDPEAAARRVAEQLAAREARQRAKQADRDKRELAQRRAAVQRERAAEAARLRRQIERSEPKARKVADEARERADSLDRMHRRLAVLDPSHRAPERAAPVSPAGPASPRLPEPAPAVEESSLSTTTELVAAIRSEALGIARAEAVDRRAVRRAVTMLARASGVHDTDRALRHLAAVCLAWAMRLGGRERSASGALGDFADAA